MNYYKILKLRWKLWRLEAEELRLTKITGRIPSHKANRLNKDIRNIKKALEYKGVLMDSITKEQAQYIDWSGTSDRVWNEWARLDRNDLFTTRCIPDPIESRYFASVNEKRLFLLMEILEGKHNDFLQTIIDKTPPK